MTKNRGRKPQRGGRREAQEERKVPWSTFAPEDMVNAGFEEYYRAQKIIPDEEWPTFLETLRRDLPLTFRVTGSRAHAETINAIIKDVYVPTMLRVEVEEKTYGPPCQIPWYPNELAWQVSAPKRVVRKSEPFKRFQRFLVGETEVGNLSRQEAVSMIPPLLLDVQSHHYCLDMCAAPGSKTAQIMEALNPHHTASSGLLVANDSDYKRTHMLVHQTGRMPSKGLIVTNLDATAIPNISLGGRKTLKFDRILADVPCSGDGTLRKNVEIWRKWGTMDANSLHSLQLRILERGMALLKPGGRLVYSTCSFNPIENEAVIAAALNSHPGQFTLLDVANQLPELKRRPGVTSWKIATQPESTGKEMIFHNSYESYRTEVEEGNEREKDKAKGIAPTAWPPANAAELRLERSMRLLPQDQNTGGFFVCVLLKAGEPAGGSPTFALPVELPSVPRLDNVMVADESGSSSLKRAPSPSTTAEGSESKKPKQELKKPKRDLGFKEDPYSFVNPSHAEVQNMSEWFKLKASFPKRNLLVRNDYGDPLRTLYLATDTVKSVIENNDYTRLRIISAGVKAFVKQDTQNRIEIGCRWRIPLDGISEILPHVGERVVRESTIRELRVLVEEQYPPVEMFHEEAQGWLRDLPSGNTLVRFEKGEMLGGHLALPLYLPVWKAKASLSLLIDKREKSMLSLRTFGEDICKQPIMRRATGETTGKSQDLAEEKTVDVKDEAGVDGGALFVAEEAGAEGEEAAANT